ncbi:MAG TPA: hypothetical protein VH834_05915 [Solirubrobacteraceae bacterium]
MSSRGAALAVCIAACLAAAPAVSPGQAPPPPCPPGTRLATVNAGPTDFDAPQGTTVVATHPTELDAQLDYYSSGAAISPNETLTLTPPPGLAVKPVANDGDPSEAGLAFTAPATPGELDFTATWIQLDSYDTRHDCTASAQVPVAVGPSVPLKAGHVFGGIQHWAGRPGALNVLTVGWQIAANAQRGDATPVTVSVRAVSGRRLPTASTPAVTSTWDPFQLRYKALVARSALVRLRSATLGLDHTATNKIDVVNASVYVYPPHGAGTTRRGIAVDITQGPRTLVHYRLVTTCTRRHHQLTCRPSPGGGT